MKDSVVEPSPGPGEYKNAEKGKDSVMARQPDTILRPDKTYL